MSAFEVGDARGPVVLREKPAQDLIDRTAYALPADASLDDFEGAAAWVRFHGGEVKACDAEGLLVVSTYLDEDGRPDGQRRYHEWIAANSLIMFSHEHNEFSAYGHSMTEHYLVEPSADDIGTAS